MSLHSVQEFVRDKNILLVGNNLTAVEKEQGYLIDKYDVIVRFGKGIPTGRSRFLGSRTDIWVTGSLRQDMRGFFPDAQIVLFNTSVRSGPPHYPKYEHTPMYMNSELEFINKSFGSDGVSRLSAGAVTAHWLLHEVGTMATMSLINFDFFHDSTPFYDGQHNTMSKASSWYIPLAMPKYQTMDPAQHPAHDIKVEKALFESLIKDDKVYFLGLKPNEPRFIKAKNIAYDSVRQRADAEQDSS